MRMSASGRRKQVPWNQEKNTDSKIMEPKSFKP